MSAGARKVTYAVAGAVVGVLAYFNPIVALPVLVAFLLLRRRLFPVRPSTGERGHDRATAAPRRPTTPLR